MKKIHIKLIIVAIIIATGLCLQQKVYATTTNYNTVTSTQKFKTIYKVKAQSGSNITQELVEYLKETYLIATVENPVLIYIPSGIYYVGDDTNLLLHSYTTIVAENDTKIVKASKSQNSIIKTKSSENVKKASIYGGIWDGNGCAKQGIEIMSAQNIEIKNLIVQNCVVNGIYVNDKSKVTIDKCNSIKNKNHGLVLYRESKVTIKDSKINYNKAYGIYVSDSVLYANNNANNQVCYNDWSGITATGSKTKVYIQKNILSYNGQNSKTTSEGYLGHGIGVQECAQANIDNNTIKSNKGCGISVCSKGAKAYISKNQIEKNERHGIGARQETTMTLVYNNIYKNNYNGVLVADRSKATFTGNTICNNKNIGISVVDNSSASLKSNNISKNFESNISASGSGASVTLKNDNNISKSQNKHGISISGKTVLQIKGNNNIINQNKQNGISVSSDSATLKITGKITVKSNMKNGIYINGANAQISNVTVSSNSKYGVTIQGKGYLSIANSVITKNKNYGINVTDSGTIAKIKYNNIYKNDRTGINIKNKAKVTTIYKNTINQNGEIGIAIKESSKVSSIEKNKINNHTKYGIAIYNSKVSNLIGNTLANVKAKKQVYKV